MAYNPRAPYGGRVPPPGWFKKYGRRRSPAQPLQVRPPAKRASAPPAGAPTGGASWHMPGSVPPRPGLFPSHDSAGRKSVVGVVSHLQERGGGRKSILNFRIHRYDRAGNQLPPMPVELRAKELRGALNEGEWIRVPGKWKRGHTKQVKRVFDITTDTWVGEKKHHGWLLLLIILAIAGVAAAIFLGGGFKSTGLIFMVYAGAISGSIAPPLGVGNGGDSDP
jgi:hypothetical protein